MEIRPFLNSDPPQLQQIWNSQPDYKCLAKAIPVASLEHLVLAKPYFDRNGILLAIQDGQCVGFVHAGYGPNEAKTDIEPSDGVINVLQVSSRVRDSDCESLLLKAAEDHLIGRGAKRIFAGPIDSLCGFYHGLYSIGDAAGVLDADTSMRETLSQSGYESWRRSVVLRRDLMSFRPVPNRSQRALLRTHDVNVDLDNSPKDWWEICRYGPLPRCGFQIVDRATRTSVGEVFWWDPSFAGTSQSAIVFNGINVVESLRRNGLGTLLMNESMKQLKKSGASSATALVDEDDAISLGFFESLGFTEVIRGTTFVKSLA